MLFHRMTLGSMTVNCYIAADEKSGRAVLFDAPDNAEKILEYINKNNLTLETVFLTHAHFDHIGALADILSRTDAKLAMHEADEKYLNDPQLNLADAAGIKLPEVHADKLLVHGDKIEVDDICIEVIHTPGHTSGSVCYLMDDVLVSGDTLFKQSIGFGNFNEEVKSIKERLMVLNDSVTVYPGHGFSTDIGRERKENPYLI